MYLYRILNFFGGNFFGGLTVGETVEKLCLLGCTLPIFWQKGWLEKYEREHLLENIFLWIQSMKILLLIVLNDKSKKFRQWLSSYSIVNLVGHDNYWTFLKLMESCHSANTISSIVKCQLCRCFLEIFPPDLVSRYR